MATPLKRVEPTTVRKIRVFVASPGDLQRERAELENLVDELNVTHGDAWGATVELVRWETHAHPSMGPIQELINEQIGPYDVFIGLMWKRFGTPTLVADSGTEEEFRAAYALWQQDKKRPVLFYFCKEPFMPESEEEADQMGKVIRFRKELDGLGLVGTYPSSREFADVVRPHLTRVLREVLSGPEPPPPPPLPARFTAFLADADGSLIVLQRALREELEKAGVSVSSSSPPKDGAESAEAETKRLISQADVSIHPLDEGAGPEIQKQLEQAVSTGRRALIWVRASWAFTEAQGHPLAQRLTELDRSTSGRNYELVRVPRANARGVILERVRALQQQWQQQRARRILVNISGMDVDLAEPLISHLEEHCGMEPLVDGFDGASSLADFEAKLRESRAVVFVFGRVGPDWVRERFIQAMNEVTANDYSVPIWAVYLAPPPPKNTQEEQFRLPLRPPELLWLDGTGGFDPTAQALKGALQQLVAGVTAGSVS